VLPSPVLLAAALGRVAKGRWVQTNHTENTFGGSDLYSSPLVYPEEEKAERGPYKCLQISQGWVSGGWGQTLFSGAQ